MPDRNAAVRGFLGELLVKEWLEKRYLEYQIVSDIRPKNLQGTRSTFDFCVVNDKKEIIAVYEVKNQEFMNLKLNNEFNKCIKYLLGYKLEGVKQFNKKSKNKAYGKNKEEYTFSDTIEVFLVMLYPLHKTSDRSKNDVKLTEISLSKIREDIRDETFGIDNKKLIGWICEEFRTDVLKMNKIFRNANKAWTKTNKSS
ncbi:MAG: hypothetical protein HQL03_09445 [Nitrospirae bacterium]|nr:hypothetical protein [Nitrospirota bacterium]